MNDDGESGRMEERDEPSTKDMLRVNNLLVGLDDKDFEKFYQRCSFVKYPAGGLILEEGSANTDVYFAVKGSLRAVDSVEDSRDLVYRDIEAGSWFGEVAAIDQGLRSAAIFASTDVILAMIPRVVFLNLILEHRHVTIKVLEHFTQILRSANTRVQSVTSFSGVQRVYTELLGLAEPDPSGDGTWWIENPPRHKDLAHAASTSQDVVARAISQLIKLEFLKREGGHYRILNRDRIRNLAMQS
jgi:CRP/FNR family transcriptional regulator, cyclic AMP receptor protein